MNCWREHKGKATLAKDHFPLVTFLVPAIPTAAQAGSPEASLDAPSHASLGSALRTYPQSDFSLNCRCHYHPSSVSCRYFPLNCSNGLQLGPPTPGSCPAGVFFIA